MLESVSSCKSLCRILIMSPLSAWYNSVVPSGSVLFCVWKVVSYKFNLFNRVIHVFSSWVRFGSLCLFKYFFNFIKVVEFISIKLIEFHTALAISRKFWYLYSVYFQIFLITSPLTYGLFRSVLFNLQIFGDCST